ncbi:MAG: Spx/MgsR family RNA polymerase-binding regulatory protein [Leptospiraceae bacterium]|nr:Spx/MgsR family RNA polymerase-binding regulatory protein [Leptospiraceae bacterium]MCP5510466.1 Spx/MgsR family RNA polymerase-binding regulatory protein [Leptospiraceae bacterium]
MKYKVYEYKNCGTCRKALKYLDSKEISYEKVPIRETPPGMEELKKMLSFVKDSKKLFNTSGGDYKSLGLKDKLASMSLEEQLQLLTTNGNLVKRPFVLGKKFGLVGFKEEEWENQFGAD